MHLDPAVVIAWFGLDFEHVRPWLQSGGYAVLFLLLFACGLGLPLPEDIPLITAGILISQGQMHLAFVAPVAWCGIIGGDCMLYRFGYLYGRNICKVPYIGKHVTVPRLQRAEVLFAKWGIWVVAVGRMFAGIRGAMVVAAGTTRFKFVKFIIADGLAAIVSGGLFISVGYWFGSNLDKMWEKAHEFKLALGIGALLVGLVVFLYVRWRTSRHTTVGQIVVDKAQEVAGKGTGGGISSQHPPHVG
jgi:membrane protein DedA with SNARE-associated domain